MRDLKGKVHDHLSRRLLLPLARLQRMARPSRRPVMLAYNAGLRFRRESVDWTPDAKRDWVLNRLRAVVRRAATETLYYRELFKEVGFDPQTDFSFDDFARLPVLEKDDIMRAGSNLVSKAVPAEQRQRDSTGGSTGAPTVVWLGPEERGWRESGRERFMERARVPTGTRTGFFWGHHLDPVAQATLMERFHAFESNARWFDCFRLSKETLERYHQEFERWRPACVVAYASALASLAEYVLEKGYRPGYPTRAFVTGAEKLLSKQREMIEAAFERPVHERYGSRDIGGMGFQLEPRRTLDYEIDWANVLLEPETTDSDSPILVTKLHADAMPMLRYRVGDVGRFPEASRTGHPALVLHEVLGRETDRIWLHDGRWVSGVQMPHMLKDYPVREFMFVQHKDYSVELKIVPRAGFGEENRRSVLATIAANLPGLDVSVALVEDIPRTVANKWRPVISEVNRSPEEVA